MRPADGELFTLDLGTRTGFAHGAPGSFPRSGSVLLKEKGEVRGVAFGNLISWLQSRFSESKPRLVLKERQLPMPATKKLKGAFGDRSVMSGLHAIVEGMCNRFGVPFVDVHDATARKAVVGIGRAGTRERTKEHVIQAVQLRGLMPLNSRDDNRADALVLFEYGAALIKGRGSWDEARALLTSGSTHRRTRSKSARLKPTRTRARWTARKSSALPML